MLAFSLFTLFTLSFFTLNSSMQDLKIWSLKELDILKNSVYEMDNFIKYDLVSASTTISDYGNYSKIIDIYPFTITKSNLIDSWGDSSCLSRINFDQSRILYYPQGIFLGTGNKSTDIEIRNSIAYLTTDSSTQAQPDFFIVDTKNPSNPIIISSLNTGPGLSSLAVAGPYVYVANTSAISQLQIIDIHNRNSPHIISQIKLPLTNASSTSPKANSIFYKNGFIYLGTSKWDGPEFYIFNVSNSLNPVIVGSFETNTLVNDIFVYENKAYLATSDFSQMRVLDISNKNNPISIYSFSPSGWQTQEGKVIDYFEKNLSLGRTVGGFNVQTNHEAFIFATSSDFTNPYSLNFISHDIPGGVYGFLFRSPFVFLATHASGSEFQVWNSLLNTKLYEKSLGIQPLKMKCLWSDLYFVSGNEMGFTVMKL